MAFLTAWWLPATTARRTQHVPLLDAWVVHLVASVSGAFLAFLLLASFHPQGFDHGVGWVCQNLTSVFPHDPVAAAFVMIVAIVSVEAGFAGLALLLAPWGAADEPLGASARNALRNTWLHTADALPWLLLLILLVSVLFDMRRKSDLAHPFSPSLPTLTTPTEDADTPENMERLAEYNRLVDKYFAEYRRQWKAYLASRPWLVRYADEIVEWAIIAAVIWILWAVMRAIGARRHVPPIIRPPVCEACGYNLTALPMEARCPECGEPVLNSLGPANRPGTAWEYRRERGRLRTWWRCSVDAAFRPTWFGRQLRVSTRVVDHRRFLVAHFVPFFIICYAIVPFADLIAGSGPESLRYDLCTVGPGFRITGATSSLLLALICAGDIGLLLGKVYRRNLIPAAMQVAAYLTGYLAFCTLVSVALGIMAYYMSWHRWFYDMERSWGLSRGVVSFFIWLVPSLAMPITYLVLLYKGTKGARYANR